MKQPVPDVHNSQENGKTSPVAGYDPIRHIECLRASRNDLRTEREDLLATIEKHKAEEPDLLSQIFNPDKTDLWRREAESLTGKLDSVNDLLAKCEQRIRDLHGSVIELGKGKNKKAAADDGNGTGADNGEQRHAS